MKRKLQSLKKNQKKTDKVLMKNEKKTTKSEEKPKENDKV